MAKSKGKIELQTEVKTQDQWEELLSKEGLIVVDAYAAWCGPCKAIVSSLKRLKNEIGDDLLHFATAETDSIDQLELYRMKSQPTFLFYAGQTLVNVVRACNCPRLLKAIKNELEREHKVLDGLLERKPYIDKEVYGSIDEGIEKEDAKKDVDDEEEEEIAEQMTKARSSQLVVVQGEVNKTVQVEKQLTVAIIKPDAVKAGLVDEIIQKVEESGLEILKKEEKTFTREEAAEFYKEHQESEHFEQLLDFMCSGPSVALVVCKVGDSLEAGEGAVEQLRDLLGPKDVNIAKEEAPNSLRALYGTDTLMNAVHGCDSAESAARELGFFFPDFGAPTVTGKRKKTKLQRTLALIRPDAYRTRKDSIIAKIQEAGFTIAMSKEMCLTKEQAEDFYAEHKDTEFFEDLVTNMSSGPMMALCLAREDAVEGWRELLGPKEVDVAKEECPDSLRAQFQVEDSKFNPLHGSDSEGRAAEEINKVFPMQATVAVIKPETETEERDTILQKIKEAGFKIQLEKEVNLTKELASQFYQEHEGKEFFEGLTDYMSSGPTMFLVLNREDAVSGWRDLMGPTDPVAARETNPDTLRALFGKDVMKNVVHGSSNPDKAHKIISEFFPDAEILPDGTVKGPEQKQEEENKTAEDAATAPEVKYDDPLGMEDGRIPDEALTASSVLDEFCGPAQGRLNAKPDGDQRGAWVAKDSDENQWLQVDLGKGTRVTKVASQGEAGESGCHVTSYSLSHSLNGQDFCSYQENGEAKVFEGNSDQESVVTNELVQPVIAQFIRVNPKTWNEQIALRAELYGHDAEQFTQPLGLADGKIPDEALTASSAQDEFCGPAQGRLNAKPDGDQKGAWVAKDNDENQWLQVDLGKQAEVTRVATQGSGDSTEHRVSSYTLSYSQDGEAFTPYKETAEEKVFEGNTDSDSVVHHWLSLPFKACFVRIQPKAWNEQIALRLELYGNAPETKEVEAEKEQEAPIQQSVEQPAPQEGGGEKDEAPQGGDEGKDDQEISKEGGEEAKPEDESTAQGGEEQAKNDDQEAPKDGGEEKEAEQSSPEEGGEGVEAKPEEEGEGGEAKPQEAAGDESKPEDTQGEAEPEDKAEESGKADEQVKDAESKPEGEVDSDKPQEGGGEDSTAAEGGEGEKPAEGGEGEKPAEGGDGEKPAEG